MSLSVLSERRSCYFQALAMPHADLEEGMESWEALVTFLQSLLAEVKEVDEGWVDPEEGIRLLQHHLANTGTLIPVLQLLLKTSLNTTMKTLATPDYSKDQYSRFLRLCNSKERSGRIYPV